MAVCYTLLSPRLVIGGLTVVLLSLGVMQVQAGMSWRLGPCPPGILAGQSWTPEGAYCQKCTCNHGGQGYSCISCGLAIIGTPEGCHVIDKFPNRPYPHCCEKAVACPGEPTHQTLG